MLTLGSYIVPPDASCSRALTNKLDKIFFEKLRKRLSDIFEKIADAYTKRQPDWSRLFFIKTLIKD